MGIKSFTPFLKKNCPEAFKDLPYSYFKGKRVAVDSDNVFRKLMARAHKEIVNETDVCSKEPDRNKIVKNWLSHVKDEISKFLKYGITLIFVFDGAYIDEKSETQLKRREEKQKRINDVEELKNKILSIDELERTPAMVTELRKKMHHQGTIKPEDKELLINILKTLGFPVLIATEEGEKLCAMLNLEGKVFAVYSRDSDIIAMGCPISFFQESGYVYNEETKKTELSLACTFFKPILSALEIEYETFLDLAVMSGNDFNSNIYNLGVGKAYKLLKEYKNIDNLPAKFDQSKAILNHVRCREIFGRQNSVDICKTEIILDLNFKNNREEIKQYGIIDWMDDLEILLKNLPVPSNIFVDKTPSLKSSSVRLKVINKVEEDNKEEEKTEEEKQKPIIPEQKASPKKINMKIVSSLNSQQLLKVKEKINVQSKEKIITLKIIKS